MVETYEIVNQLDACLKAIKGGGTLRNSARGQIDSAINAIEANNWKFACDRLSLALSQMITLADYYKGILSIHSTKNVAGERSDTG